MLIILKSTKTIKFESGDEYKDHNVQLTTTIRKEK